MSRFTAVVLDWARTTVDFGSFAPMGLFIKAFEATRGCAATNEDIDKIYKVFVPMNEKEATGHSEFLRRLDAT